MLKTKVLHGVLKLDQEEHLEEIMVILDTV